VRAEQQVDGEPSGLHLLDLGPQLDHLAAQVNHFTAHSVAQQLAGAVAGQPLDSSVEQRRHRSQRPQGRRPGPGGGHPTMQAESDRSVTQNQRIAYGRQTRQQPATP